MKNQFAHACSKFLIINKTTFFLILVAINAAVFVLKNQFIVTRRIFYNTFIERLSTERIDQIFDEGRKWHFFSIICIPFVLLIKTSFPTICIFIGLNFKGIRSSYAEIFNIALKAESVFILAHIIQIIVFLSVKKAEVFEDLNYYPLSLISITGTKDIYEWLVYPLQSLNLFELTYWLILAKGLEITCSKDYGSMLLLVLTSYVTGLVIWIMIVMLFLMSIT
jgi:hypothetical protein